MSKSIIFIGDMNANSKNLSINFIKLGYKCEIIPFVDDYEESQHFKYYIKSQQIKYHEDIVIYNGYPILNLHPIFGIFFFKLIKLYYYFKKKKIPSSRNTLSNFFNSKKNSIIIGTGISPVISKYISFKLDIYYPSSQGCEFINSPEQLVAHNKNFLISISYKFIRKEMIKSIKSIPLILNSDVGLTHETLEKLNLKKEILRIENFQRTLDNLNYKRWTNKDFYDYWHNENKWYLSMYYAQF